MSENHTRVRARESAERWLVDYCRAELKADDVPPGSIFESSHMIAAFLAGSAEACGKWEPSWKEMYDNLAWVQTSGPALFDLIPGALGRNIAEVASDLVAAAYPTLRPAIGRDGRDVLFGEAWLRAEDRYPTTRGDRLIIDDPHSVDGAESETQRDGATRKFIEGGPWTKPKDVDAYVAEVQHLAEGGPVGADELDRVVRGNLKPITDGPLADGAVVEGMMEAAGIVDPPAPLARTLLIGQTITTGDPRFDPASPVVINGYKFVPAPKED